MTLKQAYIPRGPLVHDNGRMTDPWRIWFVNVLLPLLDASISNQNNPLYAQSSRDLAIIGKTEARLEKLLTLLETQGEGQNLQRIEDLEKVVTQLLVQKDPEAANKTERLEMELCGAVPSHNALSGVTPSNHHDYKEGTWTPVLAFGGASVGITYSTQEGYYTKIGRLVEVHCKIVLTSKGSSVGAGTITGLPYSITGEPIPACLHMTNVSFADSPQGYLSSSQINLQEITNAGAVTDLADTDFANNSELMLSAVYHN